MPDCSGRKSGHSFSAEHSGTSGHRGQLVSGLAGGKVGQVTVGQLVFESRIGQQGTSNTLTKGLATPAVDLPVPETKITGERFL